MLDKFLTNKISHTLLNNNKIHKSTSAKNKTALHGKSTTFMSQQKEQVYQDASYRNI
jgi:hypothetical protein